jgi:hypothetical protein
MVSAVMLNCKLLSTQAAGKYSNAKNYKKAKNTSNKNTNFSKHGFQSACLQHLQHASYLHEHFASESLSLLTAS